VHLAFSHEFPTLAEAAAAEQQLKGWSHAKKKSLIDGDINLLKALAECRNESHSRNFPGAD
jgi:putative endonuclease